MKKRIIIAAIILVGIFVLYWIYGHSFISITVNNAAANEQLVYTLTNQASGDKVELKSDSGQVRRVVPRGSYEVSVSQGSTNSFAVVKAGGFMRTGHVDAQLMKEKARKFVGNAPEDCMSMADGILASQVCGNSYANLMIHKPAVGSLASHTAPVSSPPRNTQIMGFVNTGEGSFVFAKQTAEEDSPPQYKLYRVGGNYRPASQIVLSGLSGTKNYSITAHKDGFVVYEETYSEIWYYSSASSKPSRIEFESLNNSPLKPRSIDFRADDIAALYVGQTGDDAKDAQSIVVVKGGGSTKQLEFKGAFFGAVLCGTNKVCMLDSERLRVYDTTTEMPEQLFAISQVAAIDGTESILLVANKTGVLNLDVDNQTGFYEYMLGGYALNKLQPVDSATYVLSLTSNKDRKVAVLINRGSEDTDSIDKDIESIQKMPEVSFATIYDKNIYVSANLGDLIFNTALNSFTYNPETQKSVADKINKEIDRLGIDRKIYTITSNAF